MYYSTFKCHVFTHSKWKITIVIKNKAFQTLCVSLSKKVPEINKLFNNILISSEALLPTSLRQTVESTFRGQVEFMLFRQHRGHTVMLHWDK